MKNFLKKNIFSKGSLLFLNIKWLKIFGFTFLVLQFSCEKDVNFDFDIEPKVCLNCVLNPDSIVKARLSLSQALNEQNSLIPVEGATIALYENEDFIGYFQDNEDGNYSLALYPKTGAKYKITAEVKGYKTLSASTVVPTYPDISYSKDTIGFTEYLNMPIFNLDVKLNDPIGKDYYWLYETRSLKGKKYGGNCREINAPFVDDFNRVLDAGSDYGFTHFLQIRITDEGYDGLLLEFTIPGFLGRDEYQAQHFLHADEYYDKYIKTTIINRMKETSELPFYEPVQIYSNVENGYGIFGSCSITVVEL